MRIAFLIIIGFMFAGCSTVSNVFGGGESEDLNKITYGDDSKSSWATARAPVETPQDRAGNGSGTEGENREVASVSETGQNEALDPTEDHVRGKIETDRGAYVSHYARGDRATKADFIDLTPGDGSLWTGENDSNYFYSKVKMRALGDIITVKVEDPMTKHIGEEIKKSLTPAEQEVEMALYLKNNAAAKDDKDVQAYRNVASDDLKTSGAEDVKTRMEKAARWSQVDVSKAIGLTPGEDLRAEIIDRYQNGNYKIRTVKRIMYRGSSKLVSLVAVAPAADFDDADVIKSGKLYEYKIRVAR